MLRLLPKVVLLVALLATLVVSSVPAFANAQGCRCFTLGPRGGHIGGCQLNKNSQCVNTSCDGLCQYF
jgi:hypothetical protein